MGSASNTRFPWYCCTSVGVMVTVAVQLAPTASVAGQLLVSSNPFVAETPEGGAGSGGGSVMVTVCAGLWVCRLTSRKSSDEVDVLRMLNGGNVNSVPLQPLLPVPWVRL